MWPSNKIRYLIVLLFLATTVVPGLVIATIIIVDRTDLGWEGFAAGVLTLLVAGFVLLWGIWGAVESITRAKDEFADGEEESGGQ